MRGASSIQGGSAAAAPAVALRPALPKDRVTVFRWLSASDATAAMMGPPDYPDSPVPTWEEFLADYSEPYFTPDGDGRGRLFVISVHGRDIGCISYGGLEDWRGIAEFDMWIGSSADWGHGWGPQALRRLSDRVLEHPGVELAVIRPSRRNRRAVASYEKAGFMEVGSGVAGLPDWVFVEGLDYEDAIVLVRARPASGMRQ